MFKAPFFDLVIEDGGQLVDYQQTMELLRSLKTVGCCDSRFSMAHCLVFRPPSPWFLWFRLSLTVPVNVLVD